MKNTVKTTAPKPVFDAEGYQTNITSLNGEPLPDLHPATAWSFYHGGRRAGAGRPLSGNEPVLFRLPPRLMAKIRRKARREGKDNSKLVAELLELALAHGSALK